MKNLILSLLFLLVAGCSTVKEGSDPLIVHAQQVKRNYLYTADTIVKFEYANRNQLWKVSNSIKKTADKIREYTPVLLDTIDKSIERYRVYKNDVNKTDLVNTINLVTDNIAIAAKAYSDAKGSLK
jgi:hypothetical protein